MIPTPSLLCGSLLLAALLLLPRMAGAQDADPYEQGFQQRADLLVAWIADEYRPASFTDRGKYSFPKALARFARYGDDDAEGNRYLEEYVGDNYGFFHFPFVGMARLMWLHPRAPVMFAQRDHYLDRILNFTAYRNPTANYNAFTGEGTENHVNMSRTSGYLFAAAAASRPDLFPTAAMRRAQMEAWIENWSRRIYEVGTGEWDSSVYTIYNLIGWINLYDLAPDEVMRRQARAVIDYYAVDLAIDYAGGWLAGAESRGHTRLGERLTGSEYLCWLWFAPNDAPLPADEFWQGNDYIQSIYAATSGYRPDPAIVALARKAAALRDTAWKVNKPDYLLVEPAQAGGTTYLGDNYVLGSVATPYGGWTNASYGVINWKAVLDIDGSPAVLSGNGGMKAMNHPRGRNPYDQFLQHRNILFQLTRVHPEAAAHQAAMTGLVNQWQDRFAADFRTRWGFAPPSHPVQDGARGSLANAPVSLLHLPPGKPVELRNDYALVEVGATLVIARTVSGTAPQRQGNTLRTGGRDGSLDGFIVELVSADAWPEHEDLHAALAANPPDRDRLASGEIEYTALDGRVLVAHFEDAGTFTVMDYDWNYGVTEQRVSFNTPDWIQPAWPTGPGHGRQGQLWLNGERVESAPANTVFRSKLASLTDGQLTIATGSSSYEVVWHDSSVPSFARPGDSRPWTLSVAAEPATAGEVAVAPEQARYAASTLVTLQAVAREGWTFAGWEQDAIGSDPITEVRMDHSRRVVARFIPVVPEYEVAAAALPADGGKILRIPDRPVYPEGTEVILRAEPTPGFRFVGWEGDVESTLQELVVTVDADMVVKARFAPGVANRAPVAQWISPRPSDAISENTSVVLAALASDADDDEVTVHMTVADAALPVTYDPESGFYRTTVRLLAGEYEATVYAVDPYGAASIRATTTLQVSAVPTDTVVVYRENFAVAPHSGEHGIAASGWYLTQPNGEAVPSVKFDGNAHRCISSEYGASAKGRINSNPTGAEYDTSATHGHVWMNQMPRLNVSPAAWLMWTEELTLVRADLEIGAFAFAGSRNDGGWLYASAAVRIDGVWYGRRGNADGDARVAVGSSGWRNYSLPLAYTGWWRLAFSEGAISAWGEPAGILPSGDIEAFGLYWEKQYAFAVNRVDDFEVIMREVPAPQVQVVVQAIPRGAGETSGGGAYPAGASFTVAAEPGDRSFLYWSGDYNGDTPELSLTADQPRILRAHFGPPTGFTAAEVRNEGWYWSAWFGGFTTDGDLMFHRQHSWLLPVLDGAGGYWFGDSQLGWWYTSPDLYPVVWLAARDMWVAFAAEAMVPRRLLWRFDRGFWVDERFLRAP